MNMREQPKRVHVSRGEKYASFAFSILLVASDYLAIILAAGLAYLLRREWLPIANPHFYIPPIYFCVIVPSIFLCFLQAHNTHIRNMPFWKMAENVFWATLYSILTITMLMYFGKVSDVISRLYVGMVWVFGFLFILLFRYGIKKYLNAKALLQQPVILIGAGHTAELVLRSFHHDSGFGYKILGFIDDHPVSQRIAAEFQILGGFQDAEKIIRDMGVQTVIITAPGLNPTALVALINRIQPQVQTVAFVPDIVGAPMGNLEVESLIDEKIMMLRAKNNLARWHNRALKRAFDIVVSVCGLVVVVPLGLLLAAAIYLDSPGPVIFAHRRIGQGGREFPCYKFRSMVPHAEQVLESYLAAHASAREEWQQNFKLRNDPRITRIGAFLRKTSLDELPQLFNVLKGEMSLVGPRPIIQAEVEKYGSYIHDFYLVPPGITGMWQVNGRSDTTYEERVEMDSWYVRNWSVWIDMVYLLKTIKVVWERKGAY